MVKVDHVVLNMFFLPGASAPPKHSAASPLTAAATGCVLRLLPRWVGGDLGLGDKQREIDQI
jgi:hypothetical protein